MTEALVGEQSPTYARDTEYTALPFPEVMAEWRSQAKCKDEDGSLWFASKPKGINNSSIKGIIVNSRRKRAQRICKVCPVQYECLRYAVLNDFRDGIWAGYEMDDLTHTDRQVLRQRIKRAERKLSKTVNK
jgi:WhiB family redox-sensing transcriptional regulator